MNALRSSVLLVAGLVAATGLAGCQDPDDAGDPVDDMVDDVDIAPTDDVADATPDAGGPSMFSRTQIERGCIFDATCGGQTPIPGQVAGCILQIEEGTTDVDPNSPYARFYQGGFRQTGCGDAPNCAAYQACMTFQHSATYCTAHPGRSCDGDVLVNCTSTPDVSATNCTGLGLHCVEANGGASCTSGRTCSGSAELSCQGDTSVRCESSSQLEYPIDCTRLGANIRCFMGRCTYWPTCTRAGNRCEGDVAVQCGASTEPGTRMDCRASVDGRCVVGADAGADAALTPEGWCEFDAHECSVNDPETCMGNALRLCVNGRLVSIDCRPLGFRTCVQPSDASGMTAAHCAM
jgi:hypothetical protein